MGLIFQINIYHRWSFFQLKYFTPRLIPRSNLNKLEMARKIKQSSGCLYFTKIIPENRSAKSGHSKGPQFFNFWYEYKTILAPAYPHHIHKSFVLNLVSYHIKWYDWYPLNKKTKPPIQLATNSKMMMHFAVLVCWRYHSLPLRQWFVNSKSFRRRHWCQGLYYSGKQPDK